MTSAHRAHLVRTLHTTKINTRPSSASNSGATIGKDGAVSGTGSTHSRGTGGGGSAAITGVCVVPDSAYLIVVSSDGSATLYDFSNQSICGRWTNFRDMPTACVAFYTSIVLGNTNTNAASNISNNDNDNANNKDANPNPLAETKPTTSAVTAPSSPSGGASGSPGSPRAPSPTSTIYPNPTPGSPGIEGGIAPGVAVTEGVTKEEADEEEEEEQEEEPPNVLCVVVGDSAGQLHVLQIDGRFATSTDTGARKANQWMLEEALAYQQTDPTSVITSLHNGHSASGSSIGITMTKWISDLDLLVCSSENGVVSLIDMRKRSVARVFTGHKKHTYIQTREAIYRDTYPTTTSSSGHGSRKSPRIVVSTESDSRGGATRTTSVAAFDWSGEGKYIVSGGDGMELLVWNPYTLQILAPLNGLSSAVVGVQVCDPICRILAICRKKHVMVWHHTSFQLMQVVVDETVYRPLDVLSQLLVVVENNASSSSNHTSKKKVKNKNSLKDKEQPQQGLGLVRVFTAGNKPSMWLLEQTSTSSSSSSEGQGQGGMSSNIGGSGSDLLSVYDEEDDLCATLYSSAFALVVTVRENSLHPTLTVTLTITPNPTFSLLMPSSISCSQ